MFPRTGLSDGAGVNGGSHGAEGRGGRSRNEIGLGLYRFGRGGRSSNEIGLRLYRFGRGGSSNEIGLGLYRFERGG